MSPAIAMFSAFVALTLFITYAASRRSSGSGEFFAAGRRISAWQNGLAVAGDYMSAASFLGIAGIIAFQGYDGFLYSVGFLVAYLTVLLLIAEPLRNAGKYTMADVLAFRLNPRPVRAMAAISTLTVSTLYMVAQMVGAGALVSLLLKDSGLSYEVAVAGVGSLMLIYVVFGGMIATTWVQIVKAILLMLGTALLSFLVLRHFHFDLGAFFQAVASVSYVENGEVVTRNFLEPGLRFKPPYGHWDLLSLGLALVLGTAGLPHILVRFYTVPDARTARKSVVWAMVIIGAFYIMTTFLGFGAATIVGRDRISSGGGTNMSAPMLAFELGGDLLFAFVAAVAFATILAVVAGLTISASTSFAHDVYANVLREGKALRPGEEVRVARVTSFAVGIASMIAAVLLGPSANVAFLVALAFAVAASANLPALALSLYWRRFNTAGAMAGLATGLLSSVLLILIGPGVLGAERAIFPLENPGLVSIPLGFLGAVIGTLLGTKPVNEAKFDELLVRAHTGLGAEV